MARRLRGELHTTVGEKVVGTDQECFNPLLRNAREKAASISRSVLAVNTSSCRPSAAAGSLCILDPDLSNKRVVRVDKRGKSGGSG